MRHGLETILPHATSLGTLRRGPFRATILPDRYHRDGLFHYVIQRKGEREILAWGQEHTREDALFAAGRQIDLLLESEASARKAGA
jgi:hypothetical protein